MGKESTIVVFKPSAASTKEYMVVLDDVEEYQKWLKGDTSIPLVNFVTPAPFVSEQGSQGQWLKPAAGELASDFDAYNPDGTEKEWAHDFTKRGDLDEASDGHEAGEGHEIGGPKGRKAKKIHEEDVTVIILKRGKQQTVKHIGTGGSDLNVARGGSQQPPTGAGAGSRHR